MFLFPPPKLLNAIQLFGANLDDYLHLLLPPIVKLFDAPDVPLQARKSVPPHAISPGARRSHQHVNRTERFTLSGLDAPASGCVYLSVFLPRHY